EQLLISAVRVCGSSRQLQQKAQGAIDDRDDDNDYGQRLDALRRPFDPFAHAPYPVRQRGTLSSCCWPRKGNHYLQRRVHSAPTVSLTCWFCVLRHAQDSRETSTHVESRVGGLRPQLSHLTGRARER